LLFRKIKRIALVGFALNFVWEMLQMPLFMGMDPGALNTWLLCLEATVGDVVTILFIFGLGRLVFGRWDWPERFTIIRVLYLALVGASFAIYFEITALRAGRWAYSELMPLLPWLPIGIVPIIQMMILPYLSYRIGLKLAYRSS
jgi:hypothetical protein